MQIKRIPSVLAFIVTIVQERTALANLAIFLVRFAADLMLTIAYIAIVTLNAH